MQSAVPSPLGSHFVQVASFWKEQIRVEHNSKLVERANKSSQTAN
jgi:hypothetical protein